MSWKFYSPRSSCLCVGHILGGHILWASKSCACCRCACHRSPKSIQTTALTPFVNALHQFLDPRPASTSLSTISQKGARSHLPDHRFRADPRNTPIVLVLINILFNTSFDMEINTKNRPRTYCAPVLVHGHQEIGTNWTPGHSGNWATHTASLCRNRWVS